MASEPGNAFGPTRVSGGLGELSPPLPTMTTIARLGEGCREAGMALLGAELAELPGVFQGVEGCDVCGFALGAAERGQVGLLPEGPGSTRDTGSSYPSRRST